MKRNGLNNSKKKQVKFIIGTLTCILAVLYQPPIPMGSSDIVSTSSVTQEITALAMTQEISQVSAELETVKGNTIPLRAYEKGE